MKREEEQREGGGVDMRSRRKSAKGATDGVTSVSIAVASVHAKSIVHRLRKKYAAQ